MIGRGKKVVVAMSGGVDSSVAAALLKRDGYEVMGCFMRLGSPKGVEAPVESCSTEAATTAKHKQGCCSVLDAADARRVAGLLDIPFYVLNFEDDFGKVIDYFTKEYNSGRTPNPCVRCNDWLKFGKLADYAKAVGADYVASGHYARMGTDPATGKRILMRGVDHKKDQSYVLFGMTREAMDHTLLPIGEMEKPEVRQLAEDFKLPTFNKPDSQEICFVPNQDYAGLLKRRSPESFKEGELVTTDGQVVGKHEGHQHFTIGQRKGLGVALGYPIYVVDIDPATRRVTLGDKESLLHGGLMARQINLLSAALSVGSERRVWAKIRYNHEPQRGHLKVTGTDEIEVRFDEAQSAITPGQAVVCYEEKEDGNCGDVVLAGGWIEGAISQ
jgi:tRNA-specific 2-thiouridylase